MALCSKPSRGFPVLPREIRDMICQHIASAAGIRVIFYARYTLDLADKKYDRFFGILHELGKDSSTAKEVYQEILLGAKFIHQWARGSPIIINPTWTFLEGYSPIGGVNVPYGFGANIDLRKCLRDLEVEVKHYCLYEGAIDQTNVSYLERGLTLLPEIPYLRRLRLTVWILPYTDAYHQPMVLLGKISSPIKRLKQHFGDNMSVSIYRDLPHNIYRDLPHNTTNVFIGSHDVTWMWDSPSLTSEENAATTLGAVEERIKRLITNEADPNESSTLVDQLSVAVRQLPQEKDQILSMDDWSVGVGIPKEEWLEIKKTWKHTGRRRR